MSVIDNYFSSDLKSLSEMSMIAIDPDNLLRIDPIYRNYEFFRKLHIVTEKKPKCPINLPHVEETTWDKI